VQALGAIEGVTVTGAVPDVRPYLRRSALSITPLQIALGTQNKILESMAMEVPVVSSRIAAKGVDAVPGEHLLTADTPAELTEAILRIAGNPAERQRLGEAGRARVLTHHAWPNAMKRLDSIIERSLTPPNRLRASPAAT
jgi:glycosyltransferase involved in cell wall biosynthesis